MRIGVVGGGVYGTAVAYFLTEFGATDVTLFEAESIASGSTGYSAGIVRHHYTNEVQIRMAKRGREILERLPDYVGHDGGFHRNGYLLLPAPDDLDEFRRTVDRQRELGIDVELVDPDELTDHHPAISPADVEVGAFERTAGFADPYLVASGFAEAARENGADVHTGTPVTDLHAEDGTVTAVETPDGRHRVDYVVNAAGFRGRDVGEMVGVDLPLQRYESKIAVLRAEREYGSELPTVSDHSVKPDMYAKPEPGGEFLVGGIDRPPVDPSRGPEGVDGEFLRTVGDRIETRLPDYADARVVDSWSGIITVTPDAIQIAGVPDGLDNFYNIVGGSGHGFKEAPAFGESIAQTILGRTPEIDLAPYRLDRFDAGEGFDGISAETYGDS